MNLYIGASPEPSTWWKNVLFLENNRRSLAFKKNSKGNDKECFSLFSPSFLLFPQRLRWMHLPRLWNSLVSTSEQHLYKKGEKKGIKIYNVAVCFACSVHATWSVMIKNVVGFLAGFLALGEWQPYCKALEIYLRQIATHSILSKNKAVEIFLTSSEVSRHKQTCSSLCFKSSFFMISPSKKNFILQKRARF